MAANYYSKWAKAESWPLYDALMIIVDYNINFESYTYVDDDGHKMNGDSFYDRFDFYDKLQSKLAKDINKNKYSFELLGSSTHMTVDPITGKESLQNVSYVMPVDLIRWAIDKKLELPEEFKNIIAHPDADTVVQKADTNEKLMRDDQIAKERCRAIAEMLWDQDKTIKSKDMKIRPEILKYGRGKNYTPKTVYLWIKDLAPKNQIGIETSDGSDE